MIDRKQYDLDMDKARREQIKDISDYLSQYITLNANMRDTAVGSLPDADALAYLEKLPIPRKGRDPKEVGDELIDKVLSHTLNIQHPRFLSYVTSAVSPYSLAGSVLCDIYNPNIAGFTFAPGVGIIEEKLLRWMGSLAGFDPQKVGGVFTSGGSLSNLTGMIAARENKLPGRFDLPRGVAFTSDQTHSCVRKGMRMMGLRDDQVVIIPSDEDFRIRLDLLEEGIRKALDEGMRPFLLVGSIASTNTGAIDPLSEMADLAEKYDMWLHVDGAYGGSILFSDIYRNLAKGIERADSMAWDLHKWAMQNYSCSCCIGRDKQSFITAFAEHPEYLADVRSAEHTDGWDQGIEMSRPARCIKLWYTVQAMGTDLLSDVVDYSFYNAKVAEKTFRELPNWELLSKPMCGALNFRYVPEGMTDEEKINEVNAGISRRINELGYVFVATTTLRGKRCLRMCLINGNTTTDDVLNAVEHINNVALEVTAR